MGSADAGGCRGGLLSPVAPFPSQTAVSSPSGPRGQGARGEWGRSSSHGGTKDQGTRDLESDREPAEEGEGAEGEGTGAEGVQGAGERALPGAASRLFPQPPARPPPRPLSAAPLFPESPPPPQPFACRCPAAPQDPGNRLRGCDPGPGRWFGRCLDSWAGPSPQPSWGCFPLPACGRPSPQTLRDGDVQFLGPQTRLHEIQWNLGRGKIEFYPPRAARRESHP